MQREKNASRDAWKTYPNNCSILVSSLLATTKGTRHEVKAAATEGFFFSGGIHDRGPQHGEQASRRSRRKSKNRAASTQHT